MARCEDFPCCGHELGCCPDYDEGGRQLNMVCTCGAKLPINNPSSICDSCLRMDFDDDGIPLGYSDEYEYEEDYLEDGFDCIDDCINAGMHLRKCDDDGFCIYCGEQEENDEDDPRHGFTLVELMVAIAIVVLLAATLTVALSGVLEQARVDRTKSQLHRINRVLLQHWQTYNGRPVPLNTDWNTNPDINYEDTIGNPPAGYSDPLDPSYVPNTGRDPRINRDVRFTARVRLYALRELQTTEMPETIAEVSSGKPRLTSLTTRGRAYRRRVSPGWTVQYESAECLYLFMSLSRLGDETAVHTFKESEKGDKDGDGMMELWDAWKQPIGFVRQPTIQTPLQSLEPDQPDPFDPFRVGTVPIGGVNPATYPMAVSGGPDETIGTGDDINSHLLE